MENDIHINTADLEDLLEIPGVGPKLAEKIISARPFSSLDELLQVTGVNENFFKKNASPFEGNPSGNR